MEIQAIVPRAGTGVPCAIQQAPAAEAPVDTVTLDGLRDAGLKWRAKGDDRDLTSAEVQAWLKSTTKPFPLTVWGCGMQGIPVRGDSDVNLLNTFYRNGPVEDLQEHAPLGRVLNQLDGEGWRFFKPGWHEAPLYYGRYGAYKVLTGPLPDAPRPQAYLLCSNKPDVDAPGASRYMESEVDVLADAFFGLGLRGFGLKHEELAQQLSDLPAQGYTLHRGDPAGFFTNSTAQTHWKALSYESDPPVYAGLGGVAFEKLTLAGQPPRLHPFSETFQQIADFYRNRLRPLQDSGELSEEVVRNILYTTAGGFSPKGWDNRDLGPDGLGPLERIAALTDICRAENRHELMWGPHFEAVSDISRLREVCPHGDELKQCLEHFEVLLGFMSSGTATARVQELHRKLLAAPAADRDDLIREDIALAALNRGDRSHDARPVLQAPLGQSTYQERIGLAAYLLDLHHAREMEERPGKAAFGMLPSDGPLAGPRALADYQRLTASIRDSGAAWSDAMDCLQRLGDAMFPTAGPEETWQAFEFVMRATAQKLTDHPDLRAATTALLEAYLVSRKPSAACHALLRRDRPEGGEIVREADRAVIAGVSVPVTRHYIIPARVRRAKRS